MDCIECQALLQRAADDGATPAEQAALREHLQICAGCSRELANLNTLKTALRNPALRYAAPPELKQRIRSSANPGQRTWLMRGVAAALFMLAGAGLTFAFVAAHPAPLPQLTHEMAPPRISAR